LEGAGADPNRGILGSSVSMDLLLPLFIGFHPDDIFGRAVSVDMAELLVVFGTLAVSMGIMVVLGNWWSR